MGSIIAGVNTITTIDNTNDDRVGKVIVTT